MSIALDLARGTATGAAAGTSEQTIVNAASITIDPANGTTARVLLGGTACTSVAAGAGGPGQYLITEIVQDGTGGRSISGWSSAWLFKNGTYVPSLAANAVDVILWGRDNTSSKWFEISRCMNVMGVATPQGERLDLSIIDLDLASNGGSDATNNAGPAATASKFYFSQPGQLYGARFFWAGSTARTVRIKLWTGAGQQATVNVSTTGLGTYVGYFSSPITIEPYVVYTMSIFDTSGTDYTKIDTTSLTTYVPALLNAQNGVAVYCGKGCWYTSISTFAANDTAIPNSAAVGERYLIDPIFVLATR